ncbi:Putative transcriptional regulator of 2-aminoethylphosphonate degradation operons [Vibrio aerogenes CECT 7868]|uniref:Putative transcriptional regulator of 2-aminoethylphosphonate degradation operons n=1 Tax=Vibrio aerogenes CECT 7868 TaxID=1216006 RepID=A0A1M5ZU21_9VIBR|nr:GntR family transcriptional regulator [Vibrio aerogenes]SHI27702.1 Putative transcriptional regulator of 2-aminoethylphosphonate degradation operons [Vibrio aerogenes CECT 7868]
MQYIKIKETIEEQILQGTLSAGQKLPSERQLAESFHTTRVTLREALSLLESDGLIYREDRRGWFISPPRLRVPISSASTFRALATAQERQPDIHLLKREKRLADKHAIQLMKLPPFSELYYIQTLRLLETRPVALVTYWMNLQICRHIVENESFYDFFEAQAQDPLITVSDIHDSISLGSLVGETAFSLRATAGTPAIFQQRRIFCGSDVIALELSTWRHDALLLESLVE